jgi:parallel beta-helix repeat protein
MSGNTSNIAIGLFDTYNSVVANNIIDGGNNCVTPCNNNGYGVLFYLENLHGFAPSSAPKLQGETITGNQISNTAGSGIYLASVTGVTISTNLITHSTIQMDDTSLPAAGIALNGVDNVTVANNVIQKDGKGGICLATVHQAVIEGNAIYNSPEWGINLRVADVSTTIEKNTIDYAPIGLLIQNASVNALLETNIFNGVPQTIRYYSGRVAASPSCPDNLCY